jgi:hypothetical protein
MAVRMRVDDTAFVPARRHPEERANQRGLVRETQQNEHQRDHQLHAQPDTRRDHEIEKDDRCTHGHDGEGMANAPGDARVGGSNALALTAHDRRDSDDVVRIGRMPHPEHEADGDHGQQAHRSLNPAPLSL